MTIVKRVVNGAIEITQAIVNTLEVVAKITQGLHDSLVKVLDELKMQ